MTSFELPSGLPETIAELRRLLTDPDVSVTLSPVLFQAIKLLASIPDLIKEQDAQIERLKDDFQRIQSVYDFAKQAAEIERLRELEEAARNLSVAEAAYRSTHDLEGEASPKTGRAWDLMHRAGDKMRAALEAAKAAREEPKP